MEDNPKKRSRKYVRYEENDKIEEWLKNGILHRESKPALIKTRGEFILFSEWYKDGKLHRDDGPAIVINYDKGYIENLYYLNGIRHSEESFENAKKIVKLNNELNKELKVVNNHHKDKKLKI
jgi:hypothetical protein